MTGPQPPATLPPVYYLYFWLDIARFRAIVFSKYEDGDEVKGITVATHSDFINIFSAHSMKV